MADREQTRTDPEPRERLKEQIEAGDRDGRPGQRSARTTQLLVREDEGRAAATSTRGTAPPPSSWGAGPSRTGTPPPATPTRGEDGTARCLPDVAWQLLTPAERRLAALG